MDCRKLNGEEGIRINKEDQILVAQNKYFFYEKIREVGVATENKNRLEYWGLPRGICEQFYKHTKVSSLFDWQADCLAKSPAVLKGKKNLIYFAPTSGIIWI